MKLINEKDVEIDVKNEGILEVPEGKTVDQLPMSHFEKLAEKNGLGKITKALNNLQVWNKNDDPKLSKWAGNMIDKLNKKLKKDEAVSKRGRKRSTGKSNSVASFLDRQIESGKIDEKQITVVYDKNNNIMWLGKAGFYPLLMSNVEYRSSGYDKDHPHEFWINARSYTEPFGESYKKQLTIKESPMDYLDTNERAIVDKLEQLGYTGSRKPIMFDGKPMGYWSKTYFTDKKTSSGIQVYIDPFDGSVEVQEFAHDADTEDLTDICPVKAVRNSNDVLKIDRWAKAAKKHSYSMNYESIGYDRYDSNVEARFMDIGDSYNDMPDLYDLYAANKGLPVSEFIKDARDGGFSRTEIDAFLKDNGITGKVCEGCGKKKASRKLNEGSNFDNVTDAIDYYYGKWLYDEISYNGIADELAGLGHSERFIDAVLDGITQLYDDQERYDYEHDYDESVNVKSNSSEDRMCEMFEFGVDEDYEYKEFDIEERYGYLIYSTMTDNTFFVMSHDEYDAKKYGEWLAEIYRSDTDDQDVLLSEFYDSVPPSVYVTDPEQDDCEFDRTNNQWIVSVDGGYGGQFSIVLVGSYKGRF